MRPTITDFLKSMMSREITFIILNKKNMAKKLMLLSNYDHCDSECEKLIHDILKEPENYTRAAYLAKLYGFFDESLVRRDSINLMHRSHGDLVDELYSTAYLYGGFIKGSSSLSDLICNQMRLLSSKHHIQNTDKITRDGDVIMKTAEQLHDEICLRGIDNYTKAELRVMCQAILNAPGDRAGAIAAGKRYGWWDDSVAEPCQAILKAHGNRAMAIALAKCDGWWDDSVAEPCQAIMAAPILSDRGTAIAHAKRRGWWKEPLVLSKNDIGLGDIPINTSTIVTSTCDITIKEAWDRLTRAMIDDPEWAWSVQCNIAMPIMDHLQCNRKDANTAASMLMQHLFHYDITGHKCYQDIINCPVAMSPEQLHVIDDQQRRVVESDKQPKRLKLGKVVLLHEPVGVATVNNPVEETYIMNQLKQRYPLSDNFDPDYAKFGIRNKYDLIRGKLIPVNPEIPFHQKVKEYFIEHAYYSNSKYPSTLFMIGESLNNDSVLFKTLKVGSWETCTLIILNDELNIDDFKLVLNPAGETATTDVKSDPSVPVMKDQPSKETGTMADQTHCENVLNFFTHGMTYLKKHHDGVYYTYRDDMSSHKRLVFECKSPDWANLGGSCAFRTVDIERIDLDDWQVVESVSGITKNRYTHEQIKPKVVTESIKSEFVDRITSDHVGNVHDFFVFDTKYLNTRVRGAHFIFRGYHSTNVLCFEKVETDGVREYKSIVTYHIRAIYLSDWRSFEDVGLYSFDDTVKFCKEHNVSLITACQSVKELYKLPSIEEHKSTVPPPLDITQELLCAKHMKASSPVTVCENYAEFIKTFGNGNETVAEFISNFTAEVRDSLFELGARYTIRNYPHVVFILKHKSDTVFVFDVIELKSSTYIGLFSMQLSVLKLVDIERKHIPESPIHFDESEEVMTNSIKHMESSDGCGVSSEKVGGPTTEGSFKSGVFYQHHDYPNLLLTPNPNWNTFGNMVVFNLIDSNLEPKGTIILKESELKLADFEKVDKPEPQVDKQKVCTLDHKIILNEFFKPGVIYRHRQYPILNDFVVDSKQPESDKIAFIICDHFDNKGRSVQLIKDKIDLSDWTIVAKE